MKLGLVIEEFNIKGFFPSSAEKIDNLTFRIFNRPGHSIEVHTYGPDSVLKTLRVFRVGDEVEYSSMWVSEDGYHAGYVSAYTGPIVKIAAKTVSVRTGTGELTRMKLQNFSARNWRPT
jgi:hypothetical protein